MKTLRKLNGLVMLAFALSLLSGCGMSKRVNAANRANSCGTGASGSGKEVFKEKVYALFSSPNACAKCHSENGIKSDYPLAHSNFVTAYDRVRPDLNDAEPLTSRVFLRGTDSHCGSNCLSGANQPAFEAALKAWAEAEKGTAVAASTCLAGSVVNAEDELERLKRAGYKVIGSTPISSLSLNEVGVPTEISYTGDALGEPDLQIKFRLQLQNAPEADATPPFFGALLGMQLRARMGDSIPGVSLRNVMLINYVEGGVSTIAMSWMDIDKKDERPNPNADLTPTTTTNLLMLTEDNKEVGKLILLAQDFKRYTPPSTTPLTARQRFDNEILPNLRSNTCTGCHANGAGGYTLTANRAAETVYAEARARITVGNYNGSRLPQKIIIPVANGGLAHNGGKLYQVGGPEAASFLAWITAER